MLLFNSLALFREHSFEKWMDFEGAFEIVKSIKLLTPNARARQRRVVMLTAFRACIR